MKKLYLCEDLVSRSDRYEQGSVLIIVLVLMMVSMSLALYAVSLARDMVSTSQQLLDKLQAKLEATSTLEKIVYIGTTGRFSSWNIENISASREFPAQINLRNTPFMAGNSQLQLQDSAGRLGLWPPNSVYLKSMLRHVGIKAPEVETAGDSLIDWVDNDDLKHLNGAESYFYRAEQSKKYVPRNDHFIQAVDELILVKGWRGPVFNTLRDEIMQTASGSINMNTADALLLSGVLNVSLESAERLIRLREKNGVISRVDLMVAAPNALTNMDESITNFPSMTVAVDIRTTIRASGDLQRAVISFKRHRDRPYTIETFEE
jgi:DNA uptake protein ComE-like DNA-binding protein